MSKDFDPLKNLRKQINKTDERILKELAARFALTKKVGKHKTKRNLPPQDRAREKEIFTRLYKLAKKLKLNVLVVERLYRLILKTARAEHRKLNKK